MITSNPWKLLLAIPIFLLGINAQAANVKTGDHVPFEDWNFSVQGSGVSVDEFINSLTDMNGLLEGFTAKSSGHVHLDNVKPVVQGNHVSIPFTYVEVLRFHSDAAGVLSASNSVQCGVGEEGKTLTLTSDPPTPDNKDVDTTSIVFQVCAKTGSDGAVQVHVSSYLVAGPQWRSQVVDASRIIFANLPNDIQTHAIHYAASLSGSAQANTVAASGTAGH
jgi:hypothetical protein